MSNHLAIATVTAAIGDTIKAAIESAVGGVRITMRRPDAPAGENSARVNLYLYQVTPNAAWRNADLPTRTSAGSPVARPQAALNLHYLLSFYGDETKLEPQRLLGAAVRQLHAHPVLTQEQIRSVVQTNNDLAGSDLAEQPERVKLTPLALNLEELSKLWSVFFQTPYALSVAYEAAVVLIEADAKLQPALPVRKPLVYAYALRRPVIEQVQAAAGPGEPILNGERLVLRGRQLTPTSGDLRSLMIRLDGEVQNHLVPDVQETTIAFQLPRGHLRVGPHTVQIVQHLQLGEPPMPHEGFTSNVAAFVLLPQVLEAEYRAGNRYRVKFDPPVTREQRVTLVLHRIDPPENQQAFWSLEAPPFNWPAPQTETDTIEFDEAQLDLHHLVIAGTYRVQLRVDSCSSPLDAQTPTVEKKH